MTDPNPKTNYHCNHCDCDYGTDRKVDSCIACGSTNLVVSRIRGEENDLSRGRRPVKFCKKTRKWQ